MVCLANCMRRVILQIRYFMQKWVRFPHSSFLPIYDFTLRCNYTKYLICIHCHWMPDVILLSSKELNVSHGLSVWQFLFLQMFKEGNCTFWSKQGEPNHVLYFLPNTKWEKEKGICRWNLTFLLPDFLLQISDSTTFNPFFLQVSFEISNTQCGENTGFCGYCISDLFLGFKNSTHQFQPNCIMFW